MEDQPPGELSFHDPEAWLVFDGDSLAELEAGLAAGLADLEAWLAFDGRA